MQPLYFVKHPDNSYSIADPQPIANGGDAAEWEQNQADGDLYAPPLRNEPLATKSLTDQEIAESRERFNSDISDEDRKRLLLLLGAEMDKACITWHPGAVINPVLRAILRAEQDTRELCAQLVENYHKNESSFYNNSPSKFAMGLCRDMAERIRGKGEA